MSLRIDLCAFRGLGMRPAQSMHTGPLCRCSLNHMDCIYLDSSSLKVVGLRVIESSPSQQTLNEEVSNLESRQRELKEENERLRALLAETPHQRIQYKMLEKVSKILSLLYEVCEPGPQVRIVIFCDRRAEIQKDP